MIPEAAVEAAADWLPHDRDCDSRPERDCQCRHLRIATMRAALEATVPQMLAEAFDAGQKSGMRHADRLVAAAKIGRPELPGPLSPNPYRSQA